MRWLFFYVLVISSPLLRPHASLSCGCHSSCTASTSSSSSISALLVAMQVPWKRLLQMSWYVYFSLSFSSLCVCIYLVLRSSSSKRRFLLYTCTVKEGVSCCKWADICIVLHSTSLYVCVYISFFYQVAATEGFYCILVRWNRSEWGFWLLQMSWNLYFSP